MVIDENTVLICFKFKVEEDMIEVVYTNDMRTMEFFLRQHDFLKPSQSIDLFHRDNLFEIDTVSNHILNFSNNDEINVSHLSSNALVVLKGCVLKPFKFKSNRSDELFTIITTDKLVMGAIEWTCSSLTEVLTFNETIFKMEIEFISTIIDAITALPKMTVLNLLEDETETGDVCYNEPEIINENLAKLTPNLFADDVSFGLSVSGNCEPESYYIYNQFVYDCYVELVQPITIEAYIGTFCSTLT